MYCNENIPVPQFIDRSIDLETAVNGKRLDYFVSLLCDDTFRIPLQTNWALFIIPHSPNLNAQILQIAADYDPMGHSIAQNIGLVNEEKYQNVIGCVFAQDVRLPGENLNWETTTPYGGYLPSPVTTSRVMKNILDVGFLETNRSFSDFFIRHWISLVGYKGLVARSKETSVKSTILVFQFGTTRKPDKMSDVRKIFMFKDAVPIIVGDEDLGYDASTNTNNKRQCSFLYNSHAVLER